MSAYKCECPSPSSVTRPIHNRYLSCWGRFFPSRMKFVFCSMTENDVFLSFLKFSKHKKDSNNNSNKHVTWMESRRDCDGVSVEQKRGEQHDKDMQKEILKRSCA